MYHVFSDYHQLHIIVCKKSAQKGRWQGCACLAEIVWSTRFYGVCDFHTYTLPIQTLHSVAPELKVFVSS